MTAFGKAETCDSESPFTVGGTDNVDAGVFGPFDYVALGHLHGPQSIGRETVRYCGTPLKYSFSERNHKKSITVLELAEKGNLNIRKIPLIPLRDWQQFEGSFDEIISRKKTEDYIKVVLTDERENAMSLLRTIFPNILQLEYNRAQSGITYDSAAIESVRRSSPEELFGEFFKKQNGVDLNYRQAEIVRELFEEIAGGKNETD